MTEPQKPFEDDFGPDLVDRSNVKFMGRASNSHDRDPSYDDALKIISLYGKEENLAQANEEEVDQLARSLTSLRIVSGVWAGANMLPFEDNTEAVQGFVAHLQNKPPDMAALETLCQILAGTIDTSVTRAFEKVCAHESVQLILAGGEGRLK